MAGDPDDRRFLVASGRDGGGLYLIGNGFGARRVADAAGLSALARHPALPIVYGVGRGAGFETVYAWEFGADGLRTVATAPLHDVRGTCALDVAPDGSALYLAHYDSGHVTRAELNDHGRLGHRRTVRLDGSGPDPERQAAAHPHHVTRAGNGAVLVTDLGSDTAWELSPVTLAVMASARMPAGSGPRHASALGDGRYAFSGELDSSVILRSRAGELRPAAATRAPRRGVRNYPSDLVCDPTGGLAIVANRGADTVAMFRATADELTPVCEVPAGGSWPLNLELAGDILAVADRDSDLVALFRLDRPRATLTQFDSIAVPFPTWVLDGAVLTTPQREKQHA